VSRVVYEFPMLIACQASCDCRGRQTFSLVKLNNG
jgi:hypothetical protein